MTRRVAWTIGGAIAVAVLVAAALWVWQTSVRTSPAADATATTAPTAEVDVDVQARAQQQLDEHLDACTADEITDGVVPEGCGIRIPWGTEFAAVDSIRFRVEKLPVLELVDGGFVADGGRLVATVSGTGQDGAPRIETYLTESWSVRGDAVVRGDEVQLDVW